MTLNRSFFSLAGAFLALSTAAISLVVAFTPGSTGQTASIVAGVSMLVAVLLLYSEAKLDPDAVLTLLAVFALLTAICTGIYVFSADDAGVAWMVVTGVATLVAAALGYTTYRRQHHEAPEFPDILGRQFGPDSLLETEGIQFTGTLQPGEGPNPHWMSIYLQNTFDAPRAVTVRFDAGNQARYLRFHQEHRVRVGAAEVMAVRLPVIAPTYPGQYSLYFKLRVDGAEGRRVRLRRARTAEDRVKASTTAALLAFGHLRVGGGVKFTIGPLPDDIWVADLPAPEAETIWQPQLGTVPLHQSMTDV